MAALCSVLHPIPEAPTYLRSVALSHTLVSHRRSFSPPFLRTKRLCGSCICCPLLPPASPPPGRPSSTVYFRGLGAQVAGRFIRLSVLICILMIQFRCHGISPKCPPTIPNDSQHNHTLVKIILLCRMIAFLCVTCGQITCDPHRWLHVAHCNVHTLSHIDIPLAHAHPVCHTCRAWF